MIQRNYQRLTVYLNNPEKKGDFKTTYTYNGIQSVGEAITTVYAMHSDTADNYQDLLNKVKRVVYNGKPIDLFSQANSYTNNGWIVK